MTTLRHSTLITDSLKGAATLIKPIFVDFVCMALVFWSRDDMVILRRQSPDVLQLKRRS
ncbi:MAG: hypothetical protein KME23_10380 [Goleter apudmare HA4340-LM2]|nr:hypothetical protein [Goleter apudmare HA4340-LM2]